MLAAYLAAFAFGAVLVGASVFLGGHDHDAGDASDVGGAHVDSDTPVLEPHVHEGLHPADRSMGGAATATIFNPLLSLRFWSFFLMAFGATGGVLSLMDVSPALHVPAALITGGGSGWLVSWLLAQLKMNPVSGDTRLDRLRGNEVEVLLAAGPGREGKIRAMLSEQSIELTATCADRRVERGERVLVVDIKDGVAVVTPILPRPHPERQPT